MVSDGEHHGTDEPTNERAGIGRRQVMKALGVGTAIAFGSGTATAKHDNPHPPVIDDRYGYTTPDADDVPNRLRPDHTVELRSAPGRPGQHGPLFHFQPTGIAVSPGDIVQFTARTANHSVTAYTNEQGYQRRIPESATPFSSPVLGRGSAWLYQFDEEGVYDVFCGPHAMFGMSLRVIVGDLDEDDIPEYEDTFEGSDERRTRAPFSVAFIERELNLYSSENEDAEWTSPTSKEVLNTDALDPQNIQQEGQVSYERVLEEFDRVPGLTI